MRGFGIAICMVMLLQGCASNPYVEPTTPDVAYLTGKFLRNSTHDWESYAVDSIDGSRTPKSFWGHTAEVRLAVAPGAHRIIVKGAYFRKTGFFIKGEPLEAYFVLNVEFRPNWEYQANGVIKNLMEIWIEEKTTGARVSGPVYPCQPRPATASTPAICGKPKPDKASSE
jgi:hypothetical protein